MKTYIPLFTEQEKVDRYVELHKEEFQEFLAHQKVRRMTDEERKVFIKDSVSPTSYQRVKEKIDSGEWLLNPLPPVFEGVQPLQSFWLHLSKPARVILETKSFNTVYETVTDKNEAVGYLTCYLQQVVEYNDSEKEKEEAIFEGEIKLAEMFNKAVEKCIVGPACLASGRLDLFTNVDNTKKASVLFVWPTGRITSDPKKLNELMEEKAFFNEGELY